MVLPAPDQDGCSGCWSHSLEYRQEGWEAVPAHHPSTYWHGCIAPSYPSFPAGPGLKVLPSGQLHLFRASPRDAGTYLCVARNPSGTAAGRTRLIVQGKAATRAPSLALSSCSAPSPAPHSEMWLSRCKQVPVLAPSSAPRHCGRPSRAGCAGGVGGAAALRCPWCS